MIIRQLNLWIIYLFMFVDYYRSEDISRDIEVLTTKFEEAFEKLKTIMNQVSLDENFKQIQPINHNKLEDNELKTILTNSKEDTEKLVLKTNDVVNTIQSTLTKTFQEYAVTPSKLYSLDCANESFIFYYRAKSLKNGNPSDLKNCSGHSLPFEKDPFVENVFTNRNTATVHVPTNVYDASRDIQGVANWTENLDNTFLKYKDDSQIKWQFFCSNMGLFKIYPGIRWNIQIEDSDKDNSLVDFFDCRSEQWYLEATAYPKKMMIMVDKSGSMKGRRRIIANHTIYEILNTLTENDFFNILLFTKEFFFADNKTTGILMQATDKNKKYILDKLGHVFHPDGIAEYDVGLKASFNVLRNDKMNETEPNFYNYLLMIITDGSPMAYQELIEENNKDIGARIFTYLIGQGTTERDMVTSMACKNRGYAVEIATLADVKENVQKYLNVVARRNALMRNSFNVWTGVRQMQMQPNEENTPSNSSGFIYTTPISTTPFSISFASNSTGPYSTNMMGNFSLNMTTPMQPIQNTKIEIFEDKPITLFVTASKATFDETNETSQLDNGLLLGAAGVDVPISEFIKTAPFWKIGVNAYLFGITSNGFVLFHPKYAPQYKKHMKYFYRNIDISELEIDANESLNNMTFLRNDQIVQSNSSFQLRKEMLDQDPDMDVKFAGNLATYQLIDDFKTAFKVDRKYFVTGIKETSYKFGLAVPVDQKVPLYVSTDFKAIGKEEMKSELKLDYEKLKGECSTIFTKKNDGGITMKKYEFCYLNQYTASLQIQSPVCTLIEVMTNESTLKDCVSKTREGSVYINNVYSEIKSTAGFPQIWKTIDGQNNSIQQIFSMHHFGLIRYHNYETLSYEHFIANHSLGINDPLYQETILTSQLLGNEILVARPLPNEVIKNIVRSSLIFTITMPLTKSDVPVGIVGVQAKYEYFHSILMNNSICKNTNTIECFLITHSGLILLNNQDVKHNGNLLNEIDCALMENLVVTNIFTQQSVYDFQALCPNQTQQMDSFSMRLLNPFTQIFQLILWLFYEFFIIIQNFSISSFFWSLTIQDDNFNGIGSNFDENTAQFTVFSSEAPVHKPLGNVYPSASQSTNKNYQTESKSRRQHEIDVKNMLKEEIKQCSSNNGNENEWSGCVQKAISNICRQDKVSVAPPNDQHVDKLTPLNRISHCETACNILRSEYPKVWQEQDECKLPQKLCHKFMPIYTTLFPNSFMIQSSKKVQSTPKFEPKVEQYVQHSNEIIENTYYPNDAKSEPSTNYNIQNGSICDRFCPAKKWYTKRIKNTNLLLVILDKPNIHCSCDCNNNFGKSKEIERNNNDSLENPYMKKPIFFREFVNFTKKENSTTCSDEAQKSSVPPRLLLAFSVFLSVFIVY